RRQGAAGAYTVAQPRLARSAVRSFSRAPHVDHPSRASHVRARLRLRRPSLCAAGVRPGRRAPQHPGGIPGLPDAVTREAYSHEVSSAGFWPGNAASPHAAFFSYAYPTPEGFDRASIEPDGAFWSPELGEWLLPYDVVRTASDPDRTLLRFLQTTYRAAADLGRWDPSLECRIGVAGRPRAIDEGEGGG